MNSVSPRTEGLSVRWPSGTAEGRGLVPTNLFGQDESCVLAQFRAFVRQVPDSEVGKRCASLVAVFRESQKRSESQKVSYALWVNPYGLFSNKNTISLCLCSTIPSIMNERS
jgi:hypothetical protein